MATKRSTVLLASGFLKLIGHPLRAEIILLLDEKKSLNVTKICKKTKSEQSLVSHHLAHLRKYGIVSTERDGLQINYTLVSNEVVRLLQKAEDLAATLGKANAYSKRNKRT
jgi:DNA-binding transcriptional ArsR family regulator